MPTVTYNHQPGIQATHGNVPLAGTSHVYTVAKVLWPDSISDMLRGLFVGTSLHVCCGRSPLGDVRIDLDPACLPDIVANAADLRGIIESDSFDTVLCDPPYNGKSS